MQAFFVPKSRIGKRCFPSDANILGFAGQEARSRELRGYLRNRETDLLNSGYDCNNYAGRTEINGPRLPTPVLSDRRWKKTERISAQDAAEGSSRVSFVPEGYPR